MNIEEETLSQIEASRARTMTPMQRANILLAAESYFAQLDYKRSDYRWIVFWQYEVQGLHNGDFPTGYRPGCIAVDQDSRMYLAVGGNYDDGAERWEVLLCALR